MEIACQSCNVVTPTAQPDGAGRNYNRRVSWNTQMIRLVWICISQFTTAIRHCCKYMRCAPKRAHMQISSLKKKRNKLNFHQICQTCKQKAWTKLEAWYVPGCPASDAHIMLHPNKENSIPQSSPPGMPTHTAAREEDRSTQASAGGSKKPGGWLVC